MIEFNKILQSTSDTMALIGRIRNKFALSSTSTVIDIISTIDPHSKGYLTHTQLGKNASSQFLDFMRKKFESRISYSVLASYLQRLDNNSSSIQLKQLKGLQASHIAQLLQAECSLQKNKQSIQANIGKYIISVDSKIPSTQFEKYCHNQKISINPTLLFKFLSDGEQFIFLDKSDKHFYEFQDQQVKLHETRNKIAKLNTCLERLNERANGFGSQW